VDDGQKWCDRRPSRWLCPSIAGWFFMGENLPKRQPVDVKVPAGLTFAHRARHDLAADLGPAFRVGVHLSASMQIWVIAKTLSSQITGVHSCAPHNSAATIPPTASLLLRR
jgi:hypothetical protein